MIVFELKYAQSTQVCVSVLMWCLTTIWNFTSMASEASSELCDFLHTGGIYTYTQAHTHTKQNRLKSEIVGWVSEGTNS